ncbi:MAG: sialate O-acetylesterase [Saprospiraceae bacterium]|nr:sialate O-acetylesterase [Saprospiraceae bacterium]
MNKNSLRLFSTLCAACFTLFPLFAHIKLPAIFGSNMVLQQQTDVPMWGTADKNASVEIITSWNNKTYTTKASDEGRWKLKISTPKAGNNSYNITISDGKTLTLENVLIGEVWVCSGQSNMQMPMKGYHNQPVLGALDAVLESTNPNIRIFNVGMSASITPREDFKGKWEACNPETTPNFSATAYFFGRFLQKNLNVPIGLIASSWGGTMIQPWMNDEACQEFEFYKTIKRDTAFPKNPPKVPTTLFNAMIHPMVGYGIRGAIWYQGESNKWEPEAYQRLLPAMIQGWRNKWEQGDFPFYYVQVAPHGKNEVLPNGGFLREAQLKAASVLPNVGMACVLDAGEQNNIHPANKEAAGKRLAYLALSQTYNIKGLSPFSPVFKAMTVKNDTAMLTFENAPLGLTSYGKELTLFEIAGADKVFHPAQATIIRDGIIVKSDAVPQPVAVRYAFKNFIVGELFGTNGLPVSSFRTDDWAREK